MRQSTLRASKSCQTLSHGRSEKKGGTRKQDGEKFSNAKKGQRLLLETVGLRNRGGGRALGSGKVL